MNLPDCCSEHITFSDVNKLLAVHRICVLVILVDPKLASNRVGFEECTKKSGTDFGGREVDLNIRR